MAQILDLEETQVRRLVDTGQLQAHRIGKRGIRIFLDSVSWYQDRNAILPVGERVLAEMPRARRQASPAHYRAIAELKKKGLL